MNKIFKVIWNHATQSWVATSELSRSKGKTKSVKTAKTALAAAVAVAAATAGTSAHAAIAVGGTGATAGTTGNGVVTVVNGRAATAGTATVTGAARGMAIGENATVSYATTNAGLMDKTTSMAIGNNASVSDTMTGIAIGADAKVHAANAIAIGNNATAIKNSTNSENNNIASVVVIGNDALVRNTKLSNSRGATAIGGNALSGLLTDAGAADGAAISLTSADYGTATGCLTTSVTNPTIVTDAAKGLDGSKGVLWRAGITDVDGNALSGVTLQSNEGTAIGFDSRAIGDQSIAIGAQTISGHASVAIGGNDTYQVTSAAKQTYQTITGQTWGNDYETTYSKDGSVAVGVKSYANSSLATALGTQAKVNANSTLGTAIGSGARVGYVDGVSTNSTIAGVAIGSGSIAENNFTTAVGTGSNALAVNATALGYKAKANATNATAVGSAAIAAAADALAFGANATSYAANGVAIGTNSTVTTTGESSIAFGTDTNVSGVKSVALGSNIKKLSTEGSVVLGDSSTEVTGAGAGAPHGVGNVPNAEVTSSNGAVITYSGFAGQPADAGKYVSIGAVGAERQIKNVAAGNIAANSTDAINGSQLYSVAAELGNQVFQSTYFHVNNVTNAGKGDRATNLGNITDAAGATGEYAVTAGVNATAISNNTIAVGHNANAGINRPGVVDMPSGNNAIAIGLNSTAQSEDTIAIGRNAQVTFTEKSPNVFAVPLKSIAIGADSKSASEYSVAMGFEAVAGDNYTQIHATALGTMAKALAINAVAVGKSAQALGQGSVGVGASALANFSRAVAVGLQAETHGDLGTTVGAQSDAGYLATATGAGSQAMGNGSTAVGYRASASGENSLALARGANATTTNATAIGRLAQATHENAVALGSGSVTDVANPTTQGTVGGITYGTFAGTTPTSVVSVGSVGKERQITNVAAGRISATSTDAINGSQLYYVYEQAAKPLTFTANTNADTDAETLDKTYAAGDGTQQQLGEAIAIIGSKTNKTLAENTDAAVDSTYSSKNIQTVVTNNQVQIQMAENPEFKSILVKADANDSNPVNITSGAGNVGGTITNIEGNLEGAKTGTTAPTTAGTAPNNADTIKNNVATVGDVLNAGWNLQEKGTAKDFVKAYDTVNFIDGNATKVNVTTAADGLSSAIKYDVEVDGTTIEIKDGKLSAIASAPETTTLVDGDVNNTNNKPDGKIDTPDTTEGAKLVNATTVANAINNSGFTLKAGKTDGENTTDATLANGELVSPGDTVTMQAGKNMTVKQEADGKITYATKDEVTFNSTTVTDGTNTTNITPNSIVVGDTTAADDKPVTITSGTNGGTISNLDGNLDGAKTGTTAPTTGVENKPTNLNNNNAATVGDVLNAGWNLKENSTAKDFVTAYDTVDFINGTGTTVNITSVNGVSKVKVDVVTTGLSDTKTVATDGSTTNVADGKIDTPDATEGAKLVNATTVADAINKSGWKLKADGTTGEELINPADEVTFKAGNNLEVSREGANITYKTKADVNFDSVTISNGTTPAVKLVNEAPITATNNPTANAPTSSLNITSVDGKPTQITGVGSVLNTVATPNSTGNQGSDPNKTPETVGNVNLVDLGTGTSKTTLPDNVLNSAATVRDLANMGWVVSTPNNNFTQAVKNANQVNFIGTGGVDVQGGMNATTGIYDVTFKLTPAGTLVLDDITSNTPVSGTTNPSGKVEVKDNPAGFVGAQNIADMINGAGWKTNSTTATGGATNTMVNAGDQVNFEAGKNMTVTQKVETANGVDTISYTYATAEDVNFNSTTVGGNVITYTDADGNPLTKNADGSYKNADGSPYTGDVADVKTTVSNPITIGTVDGKNVISNLNTTLPDVVTTNITNPADNSVTEFTDSVTRPEIPAPSLNNAATLGDVLNAGWNLQGNGSAVDFVRPYDTVNFVNGTGTTAVLGSDGNVSTVTYNVNVDNKTTEITYVNKEGETVTKNDNGDFVDTDGNVVDAADVTSQISAKAPTFTANEDGSTSSLNFVDTSTTTVNVDGNNVTVDVNTGTITAETKGSVTGPVTDVLTNALKAAKDALAALPDTATEDEKKAAQDAVTAAQDAVDNAGSQVATAQNVADAINASGWRTNSTTATGKATETLVNPGEQVNFEAGKNMVVTQKVETVNGVDTISYTYATKDDVNFNSTTVGGNVITYTDADGNPLTKNDDGSYKNADGSPYTGDVADVKTTVSNPITIGTVDGKNVISNLNTTLPDVVTTNITNPADNSVTEFTDSVTRPEIPAPSLNNAATLGDVLNAGWNLQGNGSAVDFVRPYDTVNFVNGTGTTAVLGSDGNVSTVTYNVNVDGTTIAIKDGKLSAIIPPATPVSTTDLNVSTGPTTANNNTPAGKVETPTAENATKLVNAGDIAEAINNAGFTLKSSATSEGAKDATSTGDELINPGEVVEMVAGKNMTVKQEANGKITYSTEEEVDFNKITLSNGSAPAVNLTNEAATPANNNPTAPTSALNITNVDGKPTQIKGVGSVLDTTTVATNPEADEATSPVDAKLVNLGNATNPLVDSILNSAATVRDLVNMGWVVSAEDGYKDVVKNANEVKFISNSDALTVNGTTTAEGIREIAISLNTTKLSANIETTNLTVNNQNGTVVTPTTEGSKLVNATTVAGAINNAGWTTTAVNATTGATENVVVNPGEAVNYVNGNGTVANVTVSKDADGKDSVAVSYDVDKGTITPNADGSVVGISAEEAQTLQNNLADAQKALAAVEALGDNAPESVKNAAKAAVYDAEKAIAKVQNKVATVENVVNAINKSGFTLTAQGENGSLVSPGETVDMKNTDGNIKISKSKDNNDVVYNMAPDVKIEKSITAPTVNANTVNVKGDVGTTALTTVAGGNYNSAGQKIDDTVVPALSVGGNQITNVANGAINATSKDAVNGSQLYALKNDMNQQFGDVNNRIGKATKDLRAGVAGAAAIAGLPEIHLAGKSMVAVAGSTYKGQSAVAIGYSRLSDNSKVKLKLTGSSTSRGDFIGTVGVGYAW